MNDETIDNAQEIINVLNAAQDAIHLRFHRILEPYRLTVAQYKVLEHLFWHYPNGLGIKELSEHLGLAKSTISGIVDRVERDGWVRREPNPEDARKITVQLTQKGVDVFENIPKDREEFWRATIGKLSSDERETLLELLRKFRKVMEKPSEIEHRFTM